MLEGIIKEIGEMECPAGGLMDGLEDGWITDRHAAAAYGWRTAVEMVMEIIRRHMEDGGWIPCGERMPEEPYGCIVTVVDTNSGTLDDFENVLPYHAGYDGGQWNDENGGKIPFEVTAWQKCPSPYRPRQKAAGRDYRQNIMDRFMRTE